MFICIREYKSITVDSAHTYRGDFESEVVEEVRDAVFVFTVGWEVSYRTNVVII